MMRGLGGVALASLQQMHAMGRERHEIFVLGLAGIKTPRSALIPTASADKAPCCAPFEEYY